MPRIKFIDLTGEEFLGKIQRKTNLSFRKLAFLCGVSRRSFSDWKNDDYLMPFSVFEKLIEISRINRPLVKIIPDYWQVRRAGRKGGFIRNQRYGNFGTREGRSKGGKISCQNFFSNLKLAKKLRFKIRKDIYHPDKSSALAELIGIILGDGGITHYQVKVSQNKETDRAYSPYITRLFKRLFSLDSNIRDDSYGKAREIVISSRNLVEYLIKLGLKEGNKVKQQIDIPNWIKKNKDFRVACLRGLIDTDGCFHVDIHNIRGKKYFNAGLIFTSYSLPLFLSVQKILKQLDFHPTGRGRNVFLRREREVIQYFKEVGSSNPKHLSKFKKFLEEHRK